MTIAKKIFIAILSLWLFTAYAAPLAIFDCREITGREWARTLITYPVSFTQGQVKIGSVKLIDAGGDEQPCQFWRTVLYPDGSVKSARLSFYAQLSKGGNYHYELVSGGPGRMSTTVKPPFVKQEKGTLIIDNGISAIRLPDKGQRVFKTPLSFADVRKHTDISSNYENMEKNGIAFGPVAGIRLADGAWVGGSYFATEPIGEVRFRQKYQPEPATDADWTATLADAPKVTGYSCGITEQGPIFIDAVVKFTLSNGGYYQLTCRVAAGDPSISMDEETQLKSNCPPDHPLYVIISITGSKDNVWRPDALYGYGSKNEKNPDLETALNGIDIKPSMNHLPIKYDNDVVTDLVPTQQWGQQAQYFGLVNSAELALAKDGKAPVCGVAWVPQHAGSWRQAHWVFPPKSPHMFQSLLSYKNGDVAIRGSIRPQPHSQNVLHTGEYDPDFGMTGIRRLWLLATGPFQYGDSLYKLRGEQGVTNLDNYKDWILVWDADTKASANRSIPSNYNNIRGPLWHLNMALMHGGEVSRWFSHFRQSENMAWANDVAKILADPTVSNEDKGQLRSQVAAFCYLMADPDFNTRASMLHQGNPNMPINRFFALPFAARLIPDHPMFSTWIDLSAAYIRYKGGMNIAPLGVWSELVTYYAASAPTLIHGALVADESGKLDDNTRQLVQGPVDFTLYLLAPPDPRIGIRLVPGFGHEGFLWFNHWLPAAALVKKTDPDKAALYAWAWKEQNEPGESQHCNGFADKTLDEGKLAANTNPEKIKAALTSRWLPGFGAVLRNAGGDPMETYFGYRQGYLASHSDANQGDFVIYSKGAPLTLNSMYGYSIHQRASYKKLYDEFGWHSRVRFGKQSAFGGWPGGGPVSGVIRHSFSSSVDYLRAIGDYGPVPEGKLTTDEIHQRWTRQVMFMKGKTTASPNYFIFRDSFRNPAGDAAKLDPTWWTQRVLGKKEQVKTTESGFTYESEFNGVKMETRFLQPAAVAIETRDATEPGGFGRMGMGGSQGLGKGSQVKEESITVVSAGPIAAGQDILTAIVPMGKDETAPKYESLADGVVKITTSESTDYIFTGAEAIAYNKNDIIFNGIAGAVRVYADSVHLIISEGSGTVSYKGYTLTSDEPTTKIIPIKDIEKGGNVRVKSEKYTISFSLDENVGKIEELQPGIRKQKLANGTAYDFNSKNTVKFEKDDVVFIGKRGGIIIDDAAKTARLVMIDGEKIGYGKAQASECSGPYDLTYYNDKVTGVTEGPARFINITMPAGIVQLPALNIKGIRYAPGTFDNLAIIPLYQGKFEFTLENLPQPPIFRDWVRW
jgi:hypothetical protein